MSIAMHRHAALALLSLTLAASASPQPAAAEVGHPPQADTGAPPPATLTILQTYHDFGKADPSTAPAPATPQNPDSEKPDAHEH